MAQFSTITTITNRGRHSHPHGACRWMEVGKGAPMSKWNPQTAIEQAEDELRNEPGLPIKSGEEFKMERVNWLWKGWLARVKLHVIAGAKGAGKSTIGYDLAARLTTGLTWPDGTQAPVGDAIVWS